MPRIHEGGDYRRKNRGIFSLTTPFQQANGDLSFRDNNAQRSLVRNAVGVGGALDDSSMDIQVQENEGAMMSQLTWEGGTRYYTGAKDEHALETGDDIAMDELLSGDKHGDSAVVKESTMASRRDGIIAASIANHEQKRDMNDGCVDDDSVTTMDDHQGDTQDDDASIDLLQDDSDNDAKRTTTDVAKATTGCSNATPNRRIASIVQEQQQPSTQNIVAELSPATLTLDRLDAFGSQEGGAELSIYLLAKVAETHGERNMKHVMDQGTDGKTPLAGTAEKCQGGEQRGHKVRGHKVKNDKSVSSSNRRNPKSTRKPYSRFEPIPARPSKKGFNVEKQDEVFLKVGINENNAKSFHKDGNESEDDSQTIASNEHHAQLTIQPNSSAPSKFNSPESFTKEIQSVSESLAKRQCLHELKEYFMSTQNSSEYARKKHGRKDHPTPPVVPFCLPCHNPVMKLPHHGLCPKHADFFNSGSYEILNLIVDGNRIGCEACVFHFENGRPNKHLGHIVGCERGHKKNGKKSGCNDVSASRAAIGGENSQHGSLLAKDGRRIFSVSLEDAAVAGCSKCQRELTTGIKTSKSHDHCCPRKWKSRGKNTCGDDCFKRVNRGEKSERGPIWDNSNISLEDAAAAGCGKCQRELKTGIKTVSTHDDGCPRRSGGDSSKGRDWVMTDHAKSRNPSLELGASSGCRKCQIELATGLKDQKRHDINCPLGVNLSSYNNESISNLSGDKNEASSKIVEKHRACPNSDDSMNACAMRTCETTSPANDTMQRKIKSPKYDVGTVVFVESRTWSGINKPGGVARVIKVHLPTRNGFKDDDGDGEDNCTRYDVAYVVETRREKMVEERFISLHNVYVSPSKDMSSTLPDEKVDSPENEREVPLNQRGKKLRTFDCAPDGKRKSSNGNTKAGSNMNDTEEIYISSAEKCDEDGNPLSDYELLRLRNIKRNEARLTQLGLLAPAKPKAKTSNKRKSQPSNDISNGGKKTTVDAANRNVHHRQTKENNHESDDTPKRANVSYDDTEKPKKKKKLESEKQNCMNSSSSQPASTESLHVWPKVDSLVLAAKSGCRKCTLEWQSEKIDPKSYHDQCCPRRNATRIDDQTTALQNETPNKNSTERTPTSDLHGKTALKSTPGNKCTMRSISPSPALLSSRVLQSLPSFIAEFTAQPSINEDVPAPSGSKWLPCPNPWGKIGHEEGDVVIISPFQSENAHDLISIFHQSQHGFPPKRFAFNPFEQNSPYHVTHRSPARGGYSVIRLTRDRVGLIPWGFTVRNHEFGGACLVDSVEPLSPAESAEDISGWRDGQSSHRSTLCLKIHDMIISINGKTVGGMTEPEFQIELELCGPEMMLVVCRFDIADELNEMGEHGGNYHGDLIMDWNDIGAVASTVQKSVSFGECKKQTSSCEERQEALLDTTRKIGSMLSSEQSTVSKKKIGDVHSNTQRSKESSREAVGVNTQHHKTRQLTNHKNETDMSKQETRKTNGGHDNGHYSMNSSHTRGATSRSDETLIAKKSSSDKKMSHEGVGESYAVRRYRKKLEDLSDESEGEHEISFETRNKNVSSKDVCQNAHQKIHKDDPGAEESEEDDDENPWLGCVCGKTHPHPIKVFWLQCETCDAWYNVAEDCVGFDAKIAESLDEWSCWTCSPPIAGLEK